MASNDKNTVNLRPKRGNAGKNPNLEDFSVFGLSKKPTENTIKKVKRMREQLYGSDRVTDARERRKIIQEELPLSETIAQPGGQFGTPDSYFDSDATTEMSDSDDSMSIEPAEGTYPDKERKFQCSNCSMYYIEEDIHEERNITDKLHLLCHGCFRNYQGALERQARIQREIAKERNFEEIVWPEDAQVFSRNPAHFDMTQPQYPEKSITSGIIDLTLVPDSGAFWRYESDSNLIVID